MLCMAEGTPMKTHIDEFNSIITDLKSIDVKIKKKDEVLLLLCSLPPSYKHFREFFLFDRETISLEDVKAVLFSKELLEKHMSGSVIERQDDALVARGSFNDRSSGNSSQKHKSKTRNKNITCHYCKKKRAY